MIRLCLTPRLSVLTTAEPVGSWDNSAVIKRRTHDRKVADLSPTGAAVELLFFLLQGHLSVLTLIRYPFHLRAIAVALKGSWSFCPKCRWQVTNKRTCTVRMWLEMK